MNKKIDSLQVIRAVAFLGIFASHSGIQMFGAHGAWGVSVFLVLSGFVMFYSYADSERLSDYGFKSSVKFAIKKIKRLYPLHIVTMILVIPAYCYEYMLPFGSKLIEKIVLNITLLHSWIPSMYYYFSLNAVSWYLVVVLVSCMIFPFILTVMKKYKGVKDAITAIVFLVILQAVLAYTSYLLKVKIVHLNDFVHWFVYICPISRVEEFIIGCNLGYLYKHCTRDKEISQTKATIYELITGIVIIIEWALCLIYVSIPVNIDNWWGTTVLFTLSSCALIYLFALGKGKISEFLTKKPLIFIGEISANAFLIHQVVYRYLKMFEQQKFGTIYKWLNLVVCMILTIIFSVAWDKLNQRNWMRIKK